MVAAATLPNVASRLTDPTGLITREWRDFLLRLASETDNAALAAELAALAMRVTALESADDALPLLLGLSSVQVFGTLADGLVQITLEGDTDYPGNTFVYGTDPDGVKGWHLLADSFDTTTLAKTVDPVTGVISYDLAELVDTGIGAALVKLTRDAYGRVEGTEAATTDDLPEGASNLYFTDVRAQDAVVVATITNGDATHAPSGDAVFNAMSLKAPLASPSFTGPVSMAFGAASGLLISDVTTNATTKDGRVLVRHYDNTEEAIAVFGGASFDPAGFVPGNITSSTGNVARFGGGFGTQNAANTLRFFTAPTPTTLGGTLRWAITDSGHLLAGSDNAYSFGDASHRPTVLWAASGTISTSDAREKTVRGSLNGQELAAGLEIASAAVIYQWNDAIAQKGDAARLHCGPTVQDVIAIMESHGLDPFRYGFVCYDEWSETPEVWEEWQEETDEDGNVIREAGRVLAHEYRPAGNRYSLRHDELSAFRDAALVQSQRGIMDRLAALESD